MILPYIQLIPISILTRTFSRHLYEYFSFMTQFTYYSSGAYLYDPDYKGEEVNDQSDFDSFDELTDDTDKEPW